MISVTFLVAAIWLGFVLDEEFNVSGGDFLQRSAAAIVLGSLLGGWITFGFALVAGFSSGTVVVATTSILMVNLFAWRWRRRDPAWFRSLCTFDRPFWTAGGLFVALVVLFFAFGVWTDPDGTVLFRGNFTDLAYHMGTVAAFVEQPRFPPFNPQVAHAKLSYHFMADFVAAILAQGGFSFFYSLKVLMVLWAFSLGTITCRFFHQLLRNRTAMVAAAVLFFFGHIGVFHLVFGILGNPVGNEPLLLSSWHSIEDHLTFPFFNFLNVLVNYFQPQVPFLFGFPLALLILTALVRRFSTAAPVDRGSCFLIVLVALLPLFHVHSFLVLAPLTALFIGLPWVRTILGPWARKAQTEQGQATTPALGKAAESAQRPPTRPKSREFSYGIFFALAGTLLFAGLMVSRQFAFILSQPKLLGFSGFDVGERLRDVREVPNTLHAHRLWFWIRTAGMPFVLGLVAFSLPANFRRHSDRFERREQQALFLLFGVTFAYFLLINFYRFTPNWGDNNKFFLYWDLILCLFAGRLLARLWRGSKLGRVSTVLILLTGAILPTGVECAVRFLRQPSTLFTPGARITADWIRLNTPKDAVFLTSNSYTHYVPALAGRRVVNGSYTRETGYADDAIEKAVARAYRTGDPSVIETIPVTHVVVGPEERQAYWINTLVLTRRHHLIFEHTSQGARYSVYAVRAMSRAEVAQLDADDKARGFVELSRLEPQSVKQFGTLRLDESFDQSPLQLRGTTYGSGLGTHAPSEIRYALEGNYTSFEAVVGIDQSQRNGIGSVVFRVEVDGKEAFRSNVLTAKSDPVMVKVDLTGAQSLSLAVDDAGDGNHCDHADWAGSILVRKQ